MGETMEAVKKLVAMGFHVFPVRQNGKLPAVTRFYEKASQDLKALEKMFTNPKYNIGISTTKFGSGGGLLVVDIDVKNGNNGFETMEFLENVQELVFPETLCAKTASGGRHMFYRVPEAVSQSQGHCWAKV